jgi:hypothetical protein
MKEISLSQFTLDISKIIKEKDYNLIQIELEKSFDKISFTDICYNPQTELIYCGETMGNLHIFDVNFNRVQFVKTNNGQSSIVNFIPFEKETLAIYSDSTILSISGENKNSYLTEIYKSALPSSFKSNKQSLIIASVFNNFNLEISVLFERKRRVFDVQLA